MPPGKVHELGDPVDPQTSCSLMLPVFPGPVALPQRPLRVGWGVSGQEQPTDNQPTVGEALTACSQHLQAAATSGRNTGSRKLLSPSSTSWPLERPPVGLPSHCIWSLETMIPFQPPGTQGHKGQSHHHPPSHLSTPSTCSPIITASLTQVPVDTRESLTLAWKKEQHESAGQAAKPGAQPVPPHVPGQVRVCATVCPRGCPECCRGGTRQLPSWNLYWAGTGRSEHYWAGFGVQGEPTLADIKSGPTGNKCEHSLPISVPVTACPMTPSPQYWSH